MINFIKGERKSPKKSKSDKKLKKSSSKFKKKFSKDDVIKKIFEYNFIVKEKAFKETPKLFIYIINTNIL